jgi:DNA mismatch repair protein MutS2
LDLDKFMNDRTFNTLELTALIELAARHVQTPAGRQRMLQLRPSNSRYEILRSIEITTECVAYQNAGGRFGLSGIEDLEPSINQLHIEGASLEPRQILALERLLFVSKDLRDLAKGAEFKQLYPQLTKITAGIPDLKHVLNSIHGKILPTGEIDDNASPELRVIRRELTERRNRIHRALESILRGKSQAVQEEIITFRNGRFVIPVRTDSRNQVPGVIHGLSSSGQTTFVEPLTVINQNNDLVRLREQEEIEILQILFSITNTLRENREAIRFSAEIVTQLDVAKAKAAFAIEFHCTPPRISDRREFALSDARHVLLEHSLRASGEKPVPISLELDENHPVLVISGPNAGGKTVALKTIGLVSLMAQMGFHIPAREALIPIFDQVFADIGDQQSISANLSTFTAHMRNIADMAQSIRPPALILLDEVGTGTDPDEGAALAVAIVDFFRLSGAVTIASTHYPRLKMWSSQTAGVRNASVEFDERTLRPTYRLILDIAGASSGIEIARRMYVPEKILAMAQSLIEPSHAQAREYLRRLKESLDEQESLRTSLEEERSAVASKYAKLESEFATREETRRAEFDTALARIIAEFKSESERAVRKIKDRVEASRIKKTAENQTAELRRKSVKLRENIDLLKPEQETASPPELAEAADEIREGDRVKIRSLDCEGTVDSIRDSACVVIVGSLRYRADEKDLIKLSGSGHSASPQSFRKPPPDDIADQEVSSELMVIGLTADDAVDRVDKFLDQAFLAGIDNIRIIHGHGKGILRKTIAKFLTDHPQVDRFSLAPPEQGGAGATLVSLKK